jgi:hypothetical protein
VLALKDAASLENFDCAKAAMLRKEVEVFKSKRALQNRKLARDVADWVDQAMKISEDRKIAGKKMNANSDSDNYGESLYDEEDEELSEEEVSGIVISGHRGDGGELGGADGSVHADNKGAAGCSIW